MSFLFRTALPLSDAGRGLKSPLSDPSLRHRIVGFEVRARSVDVNRYTGNKGDSSDMSCTIGPVTNDAGGLVLNSKDSACGLFCVRLAT